MFLVYLVFPTVVILPMCVVNYKFVRVFSRRKRVYGASAKTFGSYMSDGGRKKTVLSGDNVGLRVDSTLTDGNSKVFNLTPEQKKMITDIIPESENPGINEL